MNRFFLVDHLPHGAAVIDQDFSVVRWNWIMEEWTRVRTDNIKGRNLGEFFPAFTTEKYQTIVRGCLDSQAPAVFSPTLHKGLIPAYNPDGSLRTHVINMTPILGDDGAKFALITIQDISEQIRISGKLRDANTQLQAEMEQRLATERELLNMKKREDLSKLTIGFAHFINNKLQYIHNAAELALTNPANQEKVGRQARQICDISKSTSQVSHTLLGLARDEEKQASVFALIPFLEDIKRKFEATRGTPPETSPMVALASPTGAETMHIRFPRQVLQLILCELLKNAAEATGDAGAAPIALEVTLENGKPEEPRAGAHARIDVRDGGQGMAPDVLAKAFDPFFTTHAGRNGIGLTMARFKAEQMGLEITLESQEGVGTTASLRVPLAQPA